MLWESRGQIQEGEATIFFPICCHSTAGETAAYKLIRYKIGLHLEEDKTVLSWQIRKSFANGLIIELVLRKFIG